MRINAVAMQASQGMSPGVLLMIRLFLKSVFIKMIGHVFRLAIFVWTRRVELVVKPLFAAIEAFVIHAGHDYSFAFSSQ